MSNTTILETERLILRHFKLSDAEALKAIIKYCIETVGLNRIWASYDSRNTNSGKVLQKAGMIYEGILRQNKLRHGELSDSVRYAILADDYYKDEKQILKNRK